MDLPVNPAEINRRGKSIIRQKRFGVNLPLFWADKITVFTVYKKGGIRGEQSIGNRRLG